MSEQPKYTPPAHLVARAEESLANASADDLARAEELYVAYGGVTEGHSAIAGAKLPPFEKCTPLVRAGWLAAARA